MLSSYPAAFFKEEGGYSVIFPDLNHLAACGETLDEASAMAIDCLAGYLYTLRQDGETAPPPSRTGDIQLEALAEGVPYDPEESFTTLVTVNVAEYARTHFESSVKKAVTIPAWLNSAAAERSIDLSQVLQEALKLRLG